MAKRGRKKLWRLVGMNSDRPIGRSNNQKPNNRFTIHLERSAHSSCMACGICTRGRGGSARTMRRTGGSRGSWTTNSSRLRNLCLTKDQHES